MQKDLPTRMYTYVIWWFCSVLLCFTRTLLTANDPPMKDSLKDVASHFL